MATANETIRYLQTCDKIASDFNIFLTGHEDQNITYSRHDKEEGQSEFMASSEGPPGFF